MSCFCPEKNPDGSLTYPCSADALKIAGLEMIAHYMDVWRHHTVAKFIVVNHQSIFNLKFKAGLLRSLLLVESQF